MLTIYSSNPTGSSVTSGQFSLIICEGQLNGASQSTWYWDLKYESGRAFHKLMSRSPLWNLVCKANFLFLPVYIVWSTWWRECTCVFDELENLPVDDEQEYPHSFDNHENNTHNSFEICNHLTLISVLQTTGSGHQAKIVHLRAADLKFKIND